MGQWNAVYQAVHTDDDGRRNTALGERITRYYYQYLNEREPEQPRLAVSKLIPTYEDRQAIPYVEGYPALSAKGADV